MKKNYKPIMFLLLLMFVFVVVGGTIAYYTSNDTFENEFEAGKYKIETQEAFVSPENWTPGTTTPKTFSVTNKGTVDSAVKVCFTQSWVDANNAPLNLKDTHNNLAAVLNFASNSDKKWLEDCSNDGVTKYCFYYYKKLEPNETTSNLLESVTFNPNVDIDSTRNCTTENGVTTCTTTATGYAGAKYTLNVNIETVQYDQYQNVFTNVTARKNGTCSALNIQEEGPPKYKVAYYLNDYDFIKDDELSQYDLTNATCEVIYEDDIVADENKYNRCIKTIKIDEHTYEEGETVELTNFPVRYNFGTSHYENGDWVYTYSSNGWEDMRVDAYFYEQNTITNYGYTFNQTDNTDMNFSNIFADYWNDSGRIGIEPSSTFTMPNHDVLFTINIPRD